MPVHDIIPVSTARSIKKGSAMTRQSWVLLAVAGLFFLACAALLAAAFLFFSWSHKEKDALSTTDQGALLAVLATQVELPQDEKPQVVTVTDIDSLKTQPFFSRAESGNVLILYIRNHLAILYNAAEHKIVNMSKITAVVIPPPAL